jgi:hypothetical protein
MYEGFSRPPAGGGRGLEIFILLPPVLTKKQKGFLHNLDDYKKKECRYGQKQVLF